MYPYIVPGVCPAVLCPAIEIPKDCRKPEFVIGLDHRTKCRVCDSNLCGKLCPRVTLIYRFSLLYNRVV